MWIAHRSGEQIIKTMKILITGGAGYIGTELTYELMKHADRIDEIIIYDNLSRGNYNLFIGLSKLPEGKVRFIQGDLLDTRKLRKALKGVDVVYHLAAKVSTPFADQNPHLFEQINHWGTAE
jgi:UDP-glucose 4-epimerase